MIHALMRGFGFKSACSGLVAVLMSASAAAQAPDYQPVDLPGTAWNQSVERFNRIDAMANAIPFGVIGVVTISAYVDAGITMSDIACEQWFDALGRDEQKTGFFKDILNVTGNLILGVAGLNGAKAASLARGSLFMSAGNASIDAYRSNFIRGVVSAVKEVVWNNRKELIKAYSDSYDERGPKTYDSAKRWLIEFHRFCSPEHIDRIVRDTIPDSRYTVDTSLSKQKNEATQLGRTRALSKLLFNEGGGALEADLMYKLYVAEVVNPVTGGSKVRADEYAKDKQVAEASEKLRRLDEKSQTDARALIQDYADGAGFPKRWAAERLSLAADGKAPSATDPALTPKPPGAPSAKAAEPRTQSSDGAIRPGQMPSLVYQPARRLRD